MFTTRSPPPCGEITRDTPVKYVDPSEICFEPVSSTVHRAGISRGKDLTGQAACTEKGLHVRRDTYEPAIPAVKILPKRVPRHLSPKLPYPPFITVLSKIPGYVNSVGAK